MAEWEFGAGDLYAGVMAVDLAGPTIRPEVSADFQTSVPIRDFDVFNNIWFALDA